MGKGPPTEPRTRTRCRSPRDCDRAQVTSSARLVAFSHVAFLLSCVVSSAFEQFYDDGPVFGINSVKQGIICEELVVDVVATEV